MNGLSTLHRINDAVRSETAEVYNLNPARPTLEGIDTATKEDYAIRRALDILRRRMREPGQTVTSPQASAQFLQLQLAEQEREVFGVLFLDTRHRMICFEELFYGTIDGASVHPHEVVKVALQHASWRTIIHPGWLNHHMQTSKSRKG